jgi:ParB family chromosome partitioning protein
MLTKTENAKTGRVASIEMVALSRLRPGEDCPLGSLNVRKSPASQQDDTETKASIEADGVIQSLLAFDMDNSGILYVGAGNRRLKFANEIAKKQKIKPEDYVVPVFAFGGLSVAEARAKSLAENIERAPLHAVDRYEAFADLRDNHGFTVDQIATRYGMARKIVEQSLALGALSERVRIAWRSGTIREDVARVFTLAADHVRQDQVLAKVTKGLPRHAQPNAYTVRQELKIDTTNSFSGGLLKIIGREAYEAAGGKFATDLFTDRKADEQVIGNPDILERLVQEKMEAECKRLVGEDGWKWAEIDDGHNRYMTDQLPQKKKYTDEEKKTCGCFVYVDHGPKICVGLGFKKSRGRAAAEKAQETKVEKAKAAPANKNAVSNALKRRLRAQGCKAVKAALTEHPHKDDLSTLLAGLCAKMLTPSTTMNSGYGYTPSDLDDAVGKIGDTIDKKVMSAALLKAFDAKDYFAGVNKHLREKALADMGFKGTVPKKAADAIKTCVAEATKTEWLPRELRTSHYGGPGAKGKR